MKPALSLLLEEERRAWIKAHGSPYLRMTFADGSEANRYAAEPRLIAEYLRATEGERGPSRPGWLFEQRLPGASIASTFLVTSRGIKELGVSRGTDSVWLHSSAANDEKVISARRQRLEQTPKPAFVAEQALTRLWVFAGEAKAAAWSRDGGAHQKARESAASTPHRLRALFGLTRSRARHDVQVRALLSVATDGTAEFLVAVAGRGYQIEKGRRGEPTQREIEALKTFAVHPNEARALRAQCELQARLEERYGKHLARVPSRDVRGTFDRLITTTDGRKCAVVVAKHALYLVQQGQEDWRALLGTQVSLSKAKCGVSMRAAPERSLRIFGLER